MDRVKSFRANRSSWRYGDGDRNPTRRDDLGGNAGGWARGGPRRQRRNPCLAGAEVTVRAERRLTQGTALRVLPRESEAFAGVAGVLIVAGGLVAAVNSAAPFAHGSWLAAYLVLVGGVSQFVLGAGRLLLPAPRLSVGLRRAQLGLWNAGIATVAVGVLTDVAALVLTGSAIVLAALGCFAFGSGPGHAGARRGVVLYRVVIGSLAASVLVGSALAGAAPGS